MPFCTKCGTKCIDDAVFCSSCGTRLIPVAQSETQCDNVGQPDAPQFVAQQQPYVNQQPSVNQPINFGMFSNITVRYCCPNGHAFDGNDMIVQCPTCKAPIQKGGCIQLYRMGNYMGCAVGMGIYIDDIPYGHIANRQSLRINVPFGTHKLHVTHTTTRACNDPIITVTPQQPHVFFKARFVKAGFKISVDPANPSEMPTV